MLRRTVTALSLLFALGAAHAGEAGRIVFVTGHAQVGGRDAALNASVQEGDELSTGRDGYVYLKTVDNGFLILRPASRARVTAYHIDREHPENTRVKLELLTGVARAISGEGVKQARQNFRFNTPVAAIGVRGTDFTVFTDGDVSRVTVISGGIVVAGFSGACGPEGNGPCEGVNARELFADKATGQLLEVKKGHPAPQLMRAAGNAPDVTAPPRGDEPPAKSAQAGDVNLEAKKTAVLDNVKLPTAPVVQPPVVVPPPVVVEPPPVVKPVRDEILWGRWSAIAALPADEVLIAKKNAGNYEAGFLVGPYFISRVSDSDLVMPSAGQASFSLVASEAFLQEDGKSAVAASVKNSRFDVDFGNRAFSTSLTVAGGDKSVLVNAAGEITEKGELYSVVGQSNATVRGYLGGAGANQAGYIFKTFGEAGLTAFGATKWSR